MCAKNVPSSAQTRLPQAPLNLQMENARASAWIVDVPCKLVCGQIPLWIIQTIQIKNQNQNEHHREKHTTLCFIV